MAALKEQLEKEKVRYRQLWNLNCAQLAEFDEALSAKEAEVKELQEQVRGLVPGRLLPRDPSPAVSSESDVGEAVSRGSTQRRGRAPPVEMFSGEDTENTLDDWIPSVKQAATWNGWTNRELLIQLAGHLKGRARQEWSLLSEEDRKDYETGVRALRARLDTGSKALAAQDESETVSDFIRRLEKTFRRAYGNDAMSSEMRDTLLFAQLQEGLQYDIMKAPAVSGALGYQALCVAAKSEERRLAELQKRR